MKTTLLIAALSMVPSLGFGQAAAGVNLKIVSTTGAGNFCMDAEGNRKANGTKVYLYTCHGRENQRWTVTTAASGSAAIIGTGGYCLDVRGGEKASAAGTPVQLWSCSFNTNQHFTIEPGGLIKEKASGKCLQASSDKEAAPIVIRACSGDPTERWRLEP